MPWLMNIKKYTKGSELYFAYISKCFWVQIIFDPGLQFQYWLLAFKYYILIKPTLLQTSKKSKKSKWVPPKTGCESTWKDQIKG